MFKKSRAWAEANNADWAILSALHGVISPEMTIEPYDTALSGAPPTARAAWADRVKNQLMNAGLREGDTVTVLAGNDYCGWNHGVPFRVNRPMQGLGIGQQLAWLNQNTPRFHPARGTLG